MLVGVDGVNELLLVVRLEDGFVLDEVVSLALRELAAAAAGLDGGGGDSRCASVIHLTHRCRIGLEDSGGVTRMGGTFKFCTDDDDNDDEVLEL